MSYRLLVLPAAAADVAEICNHLQAFRADAARFADSLQATLEREALLPTPGSPWLSTNPATATLRWTRVKAYPKYVVFLRVVGVDLHVVRVLHGARDLDSLLEA